MSRRFPEEPAGPFPEPPRTFTDGEGRDIEVAVASAADKEALFAMYLDFDPADRAQGIPPARETAIDRWLDVVLAADCVNVIARHEGDAVGHATLVPDDEGAYELAIFVLAAYQGAGIGTELLETLLGQAKREGVECVWLTVERWNHAAKAVYQSVGFETTDAERFEMEMAIRL